MDKPFIILFVISCIFFLQHYFQHINKCDKVKLFPKLCSKSKGYQYHSMLSMLLLDIIEIL